MFALDSAAVDKATTLTVSSSPDVTDPSVQAGAHTT